MLWSLNKTKQRIDYKLYALTTIVSLRSLESLRLAGEAKLKPPLEAHLNGGHNTILIIHNDL